MASKYEIEKLNENNFFIWQLKIKAILRKDNCIYAIEGRPANMTDEKWKEIDDIAVTNLHLGMTDLVLSKVVDRKTAKEIWNALIDLYDVKSLHARVLLKRKLYTLRMSETMSATDHINNMNSLFGQLTMSDFNIPENERAEILLQSLPDSYDQFIINVINKNVVDQLSFDDIVETILEEEIRRKNKEFLKRF